MEAAVMAREWPTDPDDPVDPALAPLIEAGEGEAEGFEQSEQALIGHARHDDQHGTDPITLIDQVGAAKFVETCDRLASQYGERFKVPQLLRDMAANGESFYGRFSAKAKAA
jgi:hypothetical protein